MYLIHSNGHSATRWISKNLSIDNFSKCYHSTDLIDLNPKIHKLGWNLRYYLNTESFLNEILKIEKKIFRIDEEDRDLWFYRYILKSLTEYDIDKYVDIYKKNKIDDKIDETVNELIEIGDIHKHILNSLDNTYMITKRCSRNIFNNLKTLVYKYRGFE